MDLQKTCDARRRKSILAQWLGHGLGLVFPRNCPLCDRTLEAEDDGCICPACLTDFRRIAPPMCHCCGRPVAGQVVNEFTCSHCTGKRLHYDRAISAALADTRMLDAIHRFKYQGQVFFGPQLGQLLVECARIYVPWGEIEAIVPVPLHPRKERTRQFNQARILSQALAKAFGTSLVDDNLCRVIDTPSQTFLGAEERRKNLRAAFRVRQADDFRGKRLVLVDDVYTTGSTANVCALELRKAGAEQVWVLTLARAF
jgi:ComF family protein